MGDKSIRRVAHVLPDMMPFLSGTFARLILRHFPNATIFLQSYFVWGSEAVAREKNAVWTKELPNCAYLSRSLACKRLNRFQGKMHSFVALFLPELSLCALVRLLLGPRKIIFHGYALNFATLLLLRLCGKRMSLIYWGGKERLWGRWFDFIQKWRFQCFHTIFVLMTPEIDSFKTLGCQRVELLSYPSARNATDPFDEDAFDVAQANRSVLLGNSVHHREEYREVLDQLTPSEWTRVTCMLNYGREDEAFQTQDFITHYQALYKDVFYPWTTMLPYDDYLKEIAQYPFYVYAGRLQGGLGAISASIRQGKTLLLRGNNLAWVRELGCIAYDIDQITDWSYDNLKRLQLTKEQALTNWNALHTAFSQRFTEENWARRLSE